MKAKTSSTSIVFVLLAFCSSGNGGGLDIAQDRGDPIPDFSPDVVPDGDVPSEAGGDVADGTPDPADAELPDDCIPPHALIVLDRTMSMHQAVDGTPKWTIALGAIDRMLEAYGETIWFGLEVYPRGHEHPVCVTLEERIAGTTATNPDCEDAEILVPPGPGTAGTIATTLETMLLCKSTPIEKAAVAAMDWYELNPPDIPERDQVVILITDGRETCDGTAECPITTMYGRGIVTYVIGFGGEVNVNQLNAMACAGGTASDTGPCDTSDPACTGVSSGAPSLFYLADDEAALDAALEEIAASIECGGPI
jgi:hypothetical protein